MAFNIEKTDHLFIPFSRFGNALRDSKNNTRIYKSVETLDRYCNCRIGEQPYETRHNDYVEIVEYAPVVHGRWMHTEEPLGWQAVDCMECSVCHDSWIIEEDQSFDDMPLWNYCPSCGAKMDGKEEE